MSYAIRFEDVTKRFYRGGPRYRSLRTDIAASLRRAVTFDRTPKKPTGKLVLDKVTFEVPEGDSFALIGPNGAGKTTSLKLISRIAYPTEGRIRVRGRVAALIEVGSGVHLELTGRENIWLYGQILGMSRRELKERFDEIVDFAELQHALDIPVKMYSSGMQVRLGFSIASHLNPDSFLVDEALAVGDAIFQTKCIERMSKLLAEGRTLMFVSHDLAAVESLCRHGIFILDGHIRSQGPVGDVLRDYLDWVDTAHQARLADDLQPAAGEQSIAMRKAACHAADGAERYAYETGEDIEIRLHLRSEHEIPEPHVTIGISDGRPGSLILCSTLRDGGAPEKINGEATVSCRMRDVPLLPGVYEVWCSITSEGARQDVFDWQAVGTFRIASGSGPPPIRAAMKQRASYVDGPVHVDHSWDVTA
ncbi:MAG: ABC transporter ATP-binding protein [Actinomycetota bacterium]